MSSSLPKCRLSFSPDLGIALLWTTLTVLVIALPVVRETPLRTVVAGPYLLFVPGYALVAVLFPSKGELSLFKRGVFSIGASIVVTLLWGIVLAGTPWGLTQVTLLSEGILAITLSLVAEYRRRLVNKEYQQEQTDEKRTEIGLQSSRQHSPTDPFASVTAALRQAWDDRNMIGGGNRVLQAAIVVAVLASVGATAYAIGTPLPSERYTELSVVGPNGTVEGIPSNASAGDTVTLTAGIDNHEQRSMTYGVQVQSETAGGEELLRTTNISIAPGNSQTWPIELQVPTNTSSVTFDLLLFGEKAPSDIVSPEEAYRSVRISVQTE